LAHAHGEGSPFIRAVVEEVTPAVPGLSVTTTRAPVTLLQVRNDSAQELEILSDRGEPFLRIGRGGVFANARSADWYASGNPDGVFRVPRGRLGGPPRWVKVSAEPGWSWFDHRLHPRAQVSLPPATERQTVRLFGWTVPARLGGRPGSIKGRVEWRPVYGGLLATLLSRPDPRTGVTAEVAPGRIPALFVTNAGPRPVTVLGRAGEPFARIGARRGAEVNLRSPTFADSERLSGHSPTTVADPRAKPRWRQVDDSPQYAWLDTRARYGPDQPPDELLRRKTPTVLTTWTVPLEIGSERFELRGKTSWFPTEPPGTPPDSGVSTVDLVLIGLAGLGVAAAVGVAVLRLRRRATRSVASG
jgi:hypothetical protein